MQRRLLAAALIGAICVFTAAQSAAVLAAETFPSRPITILVPFAAGGSSDVVMRLVSRQASESIGQPIIIENKPGGGGNTAALVIKNAVPDGYTLMMGHTGSHAINATLYPDLKFDPIRDFTPIAPLISFNNVLMVPQESPVTSAAELVALAKSKPEGLTYGSQGVGTGGHLLGVILAKRTGIKLVHVPYRGVAPAVTDMVAARLDLATSRRLRSSKAASCGCWRLPGLSAIRRSRRCRPWVKPAIPRSRWRNGSACSDPPAFRHRSSPGSTPNSSRRYAARRCRRFCCRKARS
jgi:tripartite-type tricarboxylate transporter receptor subunit TctC